MILLFYSRHRSIFGKRRRIGRIGPEELPKGTLRKALVYGFEIVAGKTNSSFEIQHAVVRVTGVAPSVPLHQISNEAACALGVHGVEPIVKNQVINTAKTFYGTIPIKLIELGDSIYKSDLDGEEKIGKFISLAAISNFNSVLNNESSLPLVIIEVVNTNFGKSFFEKVHKTTDNEPHVKTSKHITNFLIEHNYDALKTFRETISTNGGVSKSEIEKVRDVCRGELKKFGYKKDDNNDLWSSSH